MSPTIARYQENWRAEVNSAALYRTLADLESQSQIAQVYRRLAAVEERHARFWEKKVQAAGHAVPVRQLDWQTQVLIWMTKRFGAQFVLPVVTTKEHGDQRSYDTQPESQASTLPADERSHARLLDTISKTSAAGVRGDTLARLEGRHRAIGGNALRAAVLGANDGLVSNLSLVMGVAGAEMSAEAILITGLAGLLAGGASMAMGEWLSVQSARELYERQIGIEADELAVAPQEEAEELALIYEAKGLPAEEARSVANRLIADPSMALDTLAREELGLNPDELGGSAWVAAGVSFALFSIGALIPVVPFVFLAGSPAVLTSVTVSMLALFLLGAGITLLTGQRALTSGSRQVLIGMAAAGLTYALGRLLGISLRG